MRCPYQSLPNPAQSGTIRHNPAQSDMRGCQRQRNSAPLSHDHPAAMTDVGFGDFDIFGSDDVGPASVGPINLSGRWRLNTSKSQSLDSHLKARVRVQQLLLSPWVADRAC